MKPPKKIVLKNGLRILLVPQPENLAATVFILVEAGSEYEAKRLSGVSHFLEHLMFKGTVNRPKPGMIDHELASLGAQYNAFTDQEHTGYYVKVQAEKLPKALEIISDLYLNPIFNPEEVEKERNVIIQEINMDEDDLPTRAYRNFSALVYGDQPAGWDVAGTRKTVRALSRKDVMDYRDEHYVMPGTVVVVSGRFNEAKTVAQIKNIFGGLKRRPKLAKKATRGRQTSPRAAVQFKESDQAHLVLGFRAFTTFDKRKYALRLMASILGSGMSSRLFRRVREELGAAYYVGAGTDLSIDHGLFHVTAGVDHAKLQIVIKAILEECRRIRDELVPLAEFKKSQDQMIGSIILGLETSDELASFYGTQEIVARSVLPPEKIIAKIKKITPADVQAVAKAVIREQGLNLALVGPYKNPKPFKKLLKLS
ncbi:MAG TPA: pitrilysin family protein [Candidatus Paceibacterota bacterium]|nr:pitrilysin family protein [Candidatus Paceibacterota bacterium]